MKTLYRITMGSIILVLLWIALSTAQVINHNLGDKEYSDYNCYKIMISLRDR